MRSHEHAYIGFVREEAPDYALVAHHGRSGLVVMVLTNQAPPAACRALEQLSLAGVELVLIEQRALAPYTFEELAAMVRRDFGARSVLPLTADDVTATSQSPSHDPTGFAMRLDVLTVGHSSHRYVRHASLDPDRSTQLFFALTPMPAIQRIQIEMHAAWPALVIVDSLALLTAEAVVEVDPMEFEQHIARYNAMPLGLDDRGYSLLCTGGTLALQVLESTVALLPRARMIEIVLRCKPFASPLGDAGGLRAIGHPEDRLTATAAHLAARVQRLESLRS